jgi:hypothetical protein
MRKARITFKGAFHYTMNLGIEVEKVFSGNENKSVFKESLGRVAKFINLFHRGKNKKPDSVMIPGFTLRRSGY